MFYYYLQVGLLMLAAYLLGAILACLAHRLVASGSTVEPDLDDAVGAGAGTGASAAAYTVNHHPDRPMIEAAARPTPPDAEPGSASRFERALSEAPTATVVAERTGMDNVTVRPAPEPNLEPAPQSQPSQQETSSAADALAAASVAAAAAAAAAVVSRSATGPEVADVAPEAPLAGFILPADGPADDLTKIRNIGDFVVTKLNAVGVSQYRQIAALTPDGVHALSDRIGEGTRISRENWIEQATLLAKGQSTAYAAGLLSGGLAASHWDLQPGDNGYNGPIFGGAQSGVEVEPAPAINVTSVAEKIDVQNAIADDARSAVYGLPDDFENEQDRPSEDEADTVEDIDTQPRDAIADDARERVYGARQDTDQDAVSDGDGVSAVAVAAAAAAAGAVAAGVSAVSARDEDQAVTAREPVGAPEPAPEPEPDVPPSAVEAKKDPQDLKRIRGIDAKTEEWLKTNGVQRYDTIARFTPDVIKRAEKLMDMPGRISRESWIEQATVLAQGGQTAFSQRYDAGETGFGGGADVIGQDVSRSAPETASPTTGSPSSLSSRVAGAAAAAGATVAAAASAVTGGSAADGTSPAGEDDRARSAGNDTLGSGRSDINALRSVRSEALRRGPLASSQGDTGPDDLKRIRGIGMLIEKKLNSLGINKFEQIANWSKSDIDRFSQLLDFQGRIERENWVEQARILSSGGQTEFSRRMDRPDRRS